MIEVKLHDIGEGMTEADIVQFFVSIGDEVQADQPLVEVQTDKMVAEIPAPASGKVKEIRLSEGNTVPVGTTVLILEPTAKSMAPQALPSSAGKRVLAAPYTRKIARENNIDIEKLIGTGPAGRITDEDVWNMVRSTKKEQSSAETLVKAGTPIIAPQPDTAYHEVPSLSQNLEYIPLKGRRKQIALKMSKSFFTIPHCTHFEEVDMTNLLNLASGLKKDGVHLSVAAFFIKAISIALKDFPIFNAKVEEEHERILLEQSHNIGLAVDAEEGLIVPVIHQVEKKSLKTIHNEMKQLTQKAQENRLSLQEMSKGTFTVSNVGTLGSTGATPIINYPETGLLAFHRTKKMPVVIDDEIVIRSMMNISMSFDHRAADGAKAVAFTNRFKDLIENPTLIMLELI